MKLFSFISLLLLLSCFNFVTGQESRNAIRTYQAPFLHGVASGDPLYDRVIIWTRVTPDEINELPIHVEWRIARDTSMMDVVRSGTFVTSLERDFTVKVDVDGLEPSTCYYYDFKWDDRYSIRGRTLTADLGANELVRFAVVSCSNYEHGYFNAYRNIAKRNDINAVLHLGDYIYEYETGGYSANIGDRISEPAHEIISLDDYRLRYSHYRLDHDLQDAHQQHPFICVWDDHESANDAWLDGAENHDEVAEGSWQLRKGSSKRAYFEWMPIRETELDNSIYRKIEYGNLVNLFMLDTRLEGRSEQVGATSGAIDDPTRTLLGQNQLNWFKTELAQSTSTWNLIGQQVMMAPLKAFGLVLNTDQWDGYNAERLDILNHIMNNDIRNVVVLTGDIHTSWANDIPLNNYDGNTGANSAGVEFVVTSVTSPGFPIGFGTSVIQSFNSHMKWIDLTQHGYMILDVNNARTQAEWYFLEDINTPTENESLGNAFYVNNNERFLRQAALVSTGNNNCLTAPAFPWNPDTYLEIEEMDDLVVTYGVYPNPFVDYILIHLGSAYNTELSLTLIDYAGKQVFNDDTIHIDQGSSYLKIRTSELSSGIYFLKIFDGKRLQTHKLIKQ